MWLSACCVLLSIFPTRCFCGLIDEMERRPGKWYSENLKCFERVMNVTYFESDQFLLISEYADAIDSGFLGRDERRGWRLQSARNRTSIREFVNVIIFTHDFDSLKETLNTIDTKRINTRVKFLINFEENFEGLEAIRKASEGVSEALWNLDKTRVVLLVPKRRDILAMTYFPFASNCRPGELEVLNVCREGNFAEEIDFFPEKMLDIRGCVKNFSVLSNPSMSSQISNECTEEAGPVSSGVGGRLAYTVAEKMNLSLNLLLETPKSWNVFMDQIKRDESLFSVAGNIPVVEYLEDFDQDSGYMQESFGFGYLTGGLDVSWKNFVWPMTTEVWKWTSYTCLFSSLVLLAANLVHRHGENRSDRLSFLDFSGIFIGNVRPLPVGIFGRYLFGIWIFYSYLITAAYNSGLVSFLTTPNERGVIDSYEDLIAAGMDFGGSKIHRGFYNDPSDPVMMEVYNRFNIWSENESTRILFNGEGATGVVSSIVVAYNKNQRGKGDNKLRMLRDKAFIFHVPISMRRGSPFTIGVHRYTWRAIQSGIVQRWLNCYGGSSAQEEVRTKTPTVITVRHIRGILCLHIAGLTLSSLAFIGELLFHKYFSNRSVLDNFIGS